MSWEDALGGFRPTLTYVPLEQRSAPSAVSTEGADTKECNGDEGGRGCDNIRCLKRSAGGRQGKGGMMRCGRDGRSGTGHSDEKISSRARWTWKKKCCVRAQTAFLPKLAGSMRRPTGRRRLGERKKVLLVKVLMQASTKISLPETACAAFSSFSWCLRRSGKV